MFPGGGGGGGGGGDCSCNFLEDEIDDMCTADWRSCSIIGLEREVVVGVLLILWLLFP